MESPNKEAPKALNFIEVVVEEDLPGRLPEGLVRGLEVGIAAFDEHRAVHLVPPGRELPEAIEGEHGISVIAVEGAQTVEDSHQPAFRPLTILISLSVHYLCRTPRRPT